jgi:hypothetical protein
VCACVHVCLRACTGAHVRQHPYKRTLKPLGRWTCEVSSDDIPVGLTLAFTYMACLFFVPRLAQLFDTDGSRSLEWQELFQVMSLPCAFGESHPALALALIST